MAFCASVRGGILGLLLRRCSCLSHGSSRCALLRAAALLVGTVSAGMPHEMPRFGFGIAGLGERTVPAIQAALRAGFRLFDSATSPQSGEGFGYRQVELGQALQDGGVLRQELFMVTKVHPLDFGYMSTLAAIERALEELRTQYIDLALLHWPFCVEEFCGRGDRGSPLGDALDAYFALAEAKRRGWVHAIGLSNFDVALLEEFFEEIDAAREVAPNVLQNQVDPMNPPPRPLLRLLKDRGIALQAVGLLGFDMRLLRRDALMNRRTERVLSPVATHRTVQRIAASHSVDPALIPFAWALEHGWATIYSSSREVRIEDSAARLLPTAERSTRLRLSYSDVAEIDFELEGYIRMGVMPHPAYRDPFHRQPRVDTMALHEFGSSQGLGNWCNAEQRGPESPLQKSGFQVMRGLIEPSAVASAWRAIRRILREYSFDIYGSDARSSSDEVAKGSGSSGGVDRPSLPASLHHPGEKFDPAGKVDLVMRSRLAFDATSLTWVAPLILSRRLLDFVSCALGTEEVRLAFLPFIRATPPGPAHFDWHQDWTYLRGRVAKDRDPDIHDVESVFEFGESLIIVHVPLTATGDGAGGLRYAEGSHKEGLDITQWSPLMRIPERFGKGDMPTHFYRDGERINVKGDVKLSLEDSEELNLQPGDITSHTAFTWHRPRENVSPRARWHMELYFQDARAQLYSEPVELLVRSATRPGEVIDDVLRWVQAVLIQQAYWEDACRDPDSPHCV